MPRSGRNWERQDDGSVLYRARPSAPTIALDREQFEQIAAYERQETIFVLMTALPVMGLGILWLLHGTGLAAFLISLVVYGVVNSFVHLGNRRRILAVLAAAPISPRDLDISLKRNMQVGLDRCSNRTLLGSVVLFLLFAVGSFLALVQVFWNIGVSNPPHPLVAVWILVISLAFVVVAIREFRRRKSIKSEHR